MPYARKSFRKRPYKSRTSVRRGKPPVPKKPKTSRSYIRSNALATRANARRINNLYQQQFGPVQRNLQTTNVTLTVNATQPVAFDASDFTSLRVAANSAGNIISSNGCTVWQNNTLLTGIAAAGLFECTSNANALWSPSNSDLPDGGRYKPIRADYQLEISGSPRLDDVWVQIDLFTQHHGFQRWQLGSAGTSNAQRVMPNALINMQDMIEGNELNPSLFKRYKRIRVYLNSKKSAASFSGAEDGNQATTGNTKFVKFSIHPKKVRSQLFTHPSEPGTIQGPDGQSASGSYGQFQVDPRTPLWCMVSTTDRTQVDGDSVSVKVRRHVVWRDINGGTRV